MSELTKQQIAQRRNYFKFVLAGMPKPIDKRVLTATELSWWETMLTARNEILKNFAETFKASPYIPLVKAQLSELP